MKLAERCDTSPNYIGEIEIGRKFPSVQMIDKIAVALRIEPYHLFMNWAEKDNSVLQETFPPLPKAMTDEILGRISEAVGTILRQY